MSEETISVFDLLNLAIGTPQRGAVNFSALHALLHAILLQLDVSETSWTRNGPVNGARIGGGGGGEQKTKQRPGHKDLAPGEQEPQESATGAASSGYPTTRARQDEESQDLNKPGDNMKEDMEKDLKDDMDELKDEIKEEFKEEFKKEMEGFKEEIKEEMEELKEEIKEDIKELCSQQQGAAKPDSDEEKDSKRLDALEEMVRSLREELKRQPDSDELSRSAIWDALEATLLSCKESQPQELDHSEVSKVREVTGRVQDASQPAARGAPTGSGPVSMKELTRLADVPRPTRLADVPRPTHLADVPRPTHLADVPQPTHLADVPQPTHLADLPQQTHLADVPQQTHLADVPQQTHLPDLPQQTHLADVPQQTHLADVPQQTHLADVPQQTHLADVPQPTRHTGVPQPTRHAGMPQPSHVAGVRQPTRSAGVAQTTRSAGVAQPTRSAGVAQSTRPATVPQRYTGTLEAIRAFALLGARVTALERGKADRAQLDRLTEHYADQSSRSDTLVDQMDAHRQLIDNLLSDQNKRDSMEDLLMGLNHPGHSGSEESSLRKCVKKLEEDVKQLKAIQASIVRGITDGNLQNQLDHMPAVLDEMMQSLTSQLDGSDGIPGSGAEGQVTTAKKISELYQQYEELQDAVTGLPPPRDGHAGPDYKTMELVDGVQRAIVQLQAECETLHEATRSLTDDSKKKRSHIEELFKTTEELQEKKADKEQVECGMQADKNALDSKVSRLQFDSVTEQLNAMFHELLSRVTGQEEDWSKVIDRLSAEMERKLNRMELDSVKKQLEDRWKKILKKLKAQGAPEQEDAAGLRKQLVDRFHCLSCDRPVMVHTYGQPPVKLLCSPGFSPHKSIRPFTVYAMEQFRQHYRSMKPGAGLGYEAAVRRRQQLQRSHAMMCSQIDNMQRISRQGDNQVHTKDHTGSLHSERVPEVETTYMAVPRSSGGSHTITSAGQRRAVLHSLKTHNQVEEPGGQEEVDIIGLDGHIYKGRLNTTARNTDTKLPTISTKDGKNKDKAKSSVPNKPSATPEVHQPQSAKSSRSASSLSGRDWPVSALGSEDSNEDPLDT